MMKRRELLKLVFGSLTSFVVPLNSKANPITDDSKFVVLCNLAISHEYGAICQYISHSGILKNKKVRKILESNMYDEIVHARGITEILVKEGATPTIAVWPIQTGKEFKKLLEEDIEGENQAIKLYSSILELPESQKYRDQIHSYLKREELHRLRLVRLLNGKKANTQQHIR
jgi:rubrerythrin